MDADKCVCGAIADRQADCEHYVCGRAGSTVEIGDDYEDCAVCCECVTDSAYAIEEHCAA